MSTASRCEQCGAPPKRKSFRFCSKACAGAFHSAIAASRICLVDGCDLRHCAKGYCEKHYQRLRNTGKLTLSDPMRGASTETRFWSKVKRGDSCWLWTKEVNNKGYGVFRTWPDGTESKQFAHRYAFSLTGADITGHVVMHSCDTPRCVNPAHLSLGTQAMNIADMQEKGRGNLVGFTTPTLKECRLCSTPFYGIPARRYCDEHSRAAGLRGVPRVEVERERVGMRREVAA